ncbi:DAPG hydrolase family protein [Cupriavidus basilensis]|uniref:Hydrolase n=1 Tax=Cupriavidus basilensis TaxID=68895 RepID=A0A643FKB2_9BURK|nr:hydrolase [Cupriavidus basilensis]QOT79482.1 hydrolase [Cupriavidus basilensis]
MDSKRSATPWLDHSALLDPSPMMIETGVQRLESGALMVAVRTDLHGCKGRMFDWWFKFFDTTQHIKWWHPVDHVEHRGWDDKWRKGENYYGASIHAVESLAEIPPVAAKLKFHDPATIFDPMKLKQALSDAHVSAVVAARIGFGEHVQLDDSGDPLNGQMLHVARDTDWGCVLRSRFVLGLDDQSTGSGPTDAMGLALMRHCYTEFTFLSRFLPSLYFGERANGEVVPLPW